MSSLLENLFFKVISVAHGEEARGMLQTHRDISLVLTDYNMPVMNGLELTKEIRKSRDKNDLAIIAISANNADDITALFLKNGANDYINKPFLKEEFSCRINNSIEALENIQLITHHANRDFLTGLYNRRYFFETMEEFMQEEESSHEQFAVGMIDIDLFKNVNDTYGHDTGDKAIIHLANILSSDTGHMDIVSRFGGEEFCVVLKNINQFSALDIFERLRKKVENSSLFSTKGEEVRFTISIGVAIYHEGSLEDTIDQADMKLYQAKHNGRNQVII
jgi:diguanylate cyclase (GGDEF)-like protein